MADYLFDPMAGNQRIYAPSAYISYISYISLEKVHIAAGARLF